MKRANQLTPDELHELACRMVAANDPTEQQRLKQRIIDGFYGEPKTETARVIAAKPGRRKPQI